MPGLEWIMRAFEVLSASRTWGMDPNPIAYSEITTYAQFNRIPRREFADFCRCIQAMDQAWLQARREAIDARDNDKPKEPKK